ncbi:Oxysterol-binding protein-like protein C2F12.05c [Frankliniella fusca]|uniref:Oxysterol-binding protein-like protein C2F12.05c n=1 Tax=Frankliniella fusca TaxID=407009 RepID=A0AAE1HPB7_9NEOP|nr:Oxysterol-binding protein-like protein C2F12.05c [Frankliniella fusca]
MGRMGRGPEGAPMKPGKVADGPCSSASASAAPSPVPIAASTPAETCTLPAPAKMDKSPVKMEGYLEKKGKMRVVGMWKRYWFVLEGRLLLYYKSQQEYARLSPCRGSLNMGLASCVRPGAGPGASPDQHVLEVLLRSHVVSLRAKDRATQEQWLKALLDSMASSTATSPGKDSASRSNGKGSKAPLHFRYPSADNLSKAESPQEPDANSSGRREKHLTLPNWTRTPPTELQQPAQAQLMSVPERVSTCKETPEGAQDVLAQDEVRAAPRKGKGKGLAHLARQGSILPILGRREAAVHPAAAAGAEGGGGSATPFGQQRYSFHGVQRTKAEAGAETAETTPPTPEGFPSPGPLVESSPSSVPDKGGKGAAKPKGYRNFENILKKQLSFSSPSSEKDNALYKDVKKAQTLEEVLKTLNGVNNTTRCKFCQGPISSEIEGCNCQSTSTPILEEEKENILIHHQIFHPDENQNDQLLKSAFGRKKANASLTRKCSASEKDILIAAGVDLSFGAPDNTEFTKPVRCTSADELWSPPHRKDYQGAYMNHNFGQIGSEGHYFSASDVNNPSHPLDQTLTETIVSNKSNLVKLSIRQRLLHGNGEYIKYSEPEDCDKRDSTFNTTTDSQTADLKVKQKVPKLRKRKGSTSKDAYNLVENGEHKKRASVRNRLSFLTRVLSHVRRTKSEDVMDHPETEGFFSDDAFLSPHPDMHSIKSTTPVSRVLDDVKKMENVVNPNFGPKFKLGPTNPGFGEAPEEPPPDYDSVGMEPVMITAGCCSTEQPPQLPPRRTKRPRSPWHDVPTNNSPVIDMDNETRQRLLSAAKYGRVIGTRTSQSTDLYDWSDSHPSEHSQHHAYEVVSGDTSPAGSNEHLAIYLSSESSDEEFHEEVVLRRNLQDREFLFGTANNQPNLFTNISNSAVMAPLTISTDILPTLDSSGRLGLSQVEAMKLNLLMEAQRTSTAMVRRQKEKLDKLECTKDIPTAEPVHNEELLYQVSEECLQLPPEEFADKLESAFDAVNETTEQAMAEVQGLLSPIENLIQSCTDMPTSNACNEINKPSFEEFQEVNQKIPAKKEIEEPPKLPIKKFNSVSKSHISDSKGNDELNDLLAQLAGLTTAPLLPLGTTCSLQITAHDSDNSVRKQSLSLEAVSRLCDSDPDYDVPRPHASLLHILSQHGRSLSRPDDDGIVVEATHFFSRPETPRHETAEDQSWNGHMSPDSLDFPFLSRRSSIWDSHSNARQEPHKPRSKKDRSRRATLNGPITQKPVESISQNARPPVRRNSVELPAMTVLCGGILNQKDRGMNEPKLVKRLSSYEGATCEHSSPCQSLTQNNSSNLESLGNTPDAFLSLEDISEKSELNSDAQLQDVLTGNARLSARGEDLDMDSLEASELKKLDVPDMIPPALGSIVEESDIVSDKSDAVNGGDFQSSGSASEGAVMIGNSDSSGDQLTTHNTDTDMDMSSDDEINQKDQILNDIQSIGRVIEPDSLLEPSHLGKLLVSETVTVENDSTKDASLETDSLEIRV